MNLDHAYTPKTWPRRDSCDRKVDEGDGRVRLCGERLGNHPQLICARCGEEPMADEARYTAKLGGTHYRRKYRDTAYGAHTIYTAASCGPWVDASLGAENRQAKLDEWRKAKADG